MVFRLGIIISAVLLGLVMLYLKKKENWEWEKIIILLMATIVGISIFGGIGIFVYIKASEKPETQTSFWDITLSNSKSTIKFIKGPPVKISNDGFWFYLSNIHGASEIYFLRFRDDQLWIVGYMGGGISGGPGIHGIKQGSDLDDMNTFFGNPSHVFDSRNGPKKLHLYRKYNVFFVTEDSEISSYGVYNPEYGSFEIGETMEKPPIAMKVNAR